MKTSIILNWPLKSIQIFLLKAKIIKSVVQNSFKNYFLIVGHYNPVTIGLLIFPLTLYFNFLHNSFGINQSSWEAFKNLTKTNLPKLNAFSYKVSWETFQKTNYFELGSLGSDLSKLKAKRQKNLFLNLNNSELLKNCIDSIHVWPDLLIFDFNSTWLNKKKNYYFGTLKNSQAANPGIKGNFWFFPARENFDSSYLKKNNLLKNSEKISFYSCDEFPLKLKGVVNKSSLLKSSLITFTTHNKNLIDFSDSSFNFENSFVLKKAQPKLIGIYSHEIEELQTEKNSDSEFLSKVLKNHSKNSFLYKNWKKVSTTMNDHFLTQNSFYSESLFIKEELKALEKLSKNLKKLSSNHFLKLTDLFLKEVDPSSKPLLNSDLKNPLFLRQMSGFEVPDMNSKQIYNLLKMNPLKSHKKIKYEIFLGPNFVFPAFYTPQEAFSVPIKFNYLPIKFECYDCIFYEGPAVVIDAQQKSFGFENLEESFMSFQKVFTPTDPRNKDFRVYFGTSDFFEEKESEKFIFSKFKNLQDNLTDTRKKKGRPVKKVLPDQKKPIRQKKFDLKSHYEVLFMTNKEWTLFKSQNLDKPPLLLSFPLREIHLLKNNAPSSVLDSCDYPNQEWFFKSLVSEKSDLLKLHFYESLGTEFLFPFELSSKAFFKSHFQKRGTNYVANKIDQTFKSSQIKMRQSWELIHLNSWFIIYQYFFAVLIIYVFKEFVLEYARELGAYLIDLFASLGIVDESFKDEFLPNQSNSGGRLIKKTSKKFSDIAGIEPIFSELSEIVWFLRNSGHSFKVSRILPKGVLLVGDPGTGKTLLVQALAGEAQVPVFVQSASGLKGLEGLGAQRIQNVFEKAKQLAPSIIFFDEIDSIGERRSNVLQIKIGTTSLKPNGEFQNLASPFQKFKSHKLKAVKDTQPKEQNPEQLSVLMQLLIELDGLQTNRLVLVVGATNRPDSLDPALTRPGRFDKVFALAVPKKTKRIDICKLYGNNLGLDETICWDYIGNRTFGLSGAYLAAIMNQSSIQAILNGTSHTIETLEYGIDKITNYSSELESEIRSAKRPFGIARFAYYNSGLALVETLFNPQSPAIYCSLWPKQKTSRSNQLIDDMILKNYFFKRRIECESELITLLSGKVCEALFFSNFSKNWQSNLGTQELKKATYLAFLSVDCWYFYSKNILLNKIFTFEENRNYSEVFDSNLLDFLKQLTKSIETDPIRPQSLKYRNFQRWETKPWWQIQVCEEPKAVEKNASARWYRIGVSNPNENESNDEWVMPDYNFHNNGTYFLTKTIHWEDINQSARDLLYQSLLTSSFYLACEILDDSREFLDFFVDELIQKQFLRQYEIENLFNQFFEKTSSKVLASNSSDFSDSEINLNFSFSEFDFLFQKRWGVLSRK